MNTPTHTLVALAALSKPGETVRNRWILFGALIPDMLIFIWAPWQRWVIGRDWQSIWEQHYFDTPMQTGIALFNSLPIFAILLLIGFWQRRHRWGLCLWVFALAALLHVALDAPVHGHDAYRHLWPFSDWRFYSPVSYWEVGLHARWVSLVETALVIGSAIILWRRFPSRWVKVTLSILVMLMIMTTAAQQLAPMLTAS